MPSVPERRYTAEEYLALEAVSEHRSEFYRGEIFAMSGGTVNHNRIARNLLTRLYSNLQKSEDCEALGSDQQILIRASQLYTYADAVVGCGELQMDRNALLNPRVIFEVLSKSTERYDRGKKFEHYRSLTLLREYILVSQAEPLVERYVVQADGSWRVFFHRGLESMVEFEALGCRLSCTDIYQGVEFQAAIEDSE